ncbi:MAG: type II secretion system protein GspM [Hyphomonas sp.]
MTDWWQNLTIRERGLIALAAIICGGFIFLQLIISPALKARTAKKIDVAGTAQMLDHLSHRGKSAGTSGSATSNAFKENLDPDSFRRAILDTANNRGLTITRVQMTDDGKVTVQLDDTPPQAVFAWLFDLKRTVGVEVSKATMSNVGSNLVRSSFEFGGGPQE